MTTAPTNHSSTLLLETRNLTLSINDKLLLKELNLNLHNGSRLGILGQNGTGKTTFLHSLVRLATPSSGEIQISGKLIDSYSRKDLAKKTGILLQHLDAEMPTSVSEFALIGRHPHLPAWRWESSDDQRLAHNALTQMRIEHLAQRDIRTLSGGERQRLAIAALLVQAPEIYLLDEPGNHLDIALQIKSLELLCAKVKGNQAALVMATHDINLAARFCDQILLLLGDGRFVYGANEEVLTTENLSLAYDCTIASASHKGGHVYFPA